MKTYLSIYADAGCPYIGLGSSARGAVAIQIAIHQSAWTPWQKWGDVEARTASGTHQFRALFAFTPPHNAVGWKIATPPGVLIKEGEIFSLTPSPEYFRETRGHDSRADICGYCGTDATGCRVGVDCPSCGGC